MSQPDQKDQPIKETRDGILEEIKNSNDIPLHPLRDGDGDTFFFENKKGGI